MLRVIKEFRPTWVIGENVDGIRNMVEFDTELPVDSRRYTKEKMADGSLRVGEVRGREGKGILDKILGDLKQIGYQVKPFVIPACAVNAKHNRARIWIVGYSEHQGADSIRKTTAHGNGVRSQKPGAEQPADRFRQFYETVTHPKGQQRRGCTGQECRGNKSRLLTEEQERGQVRSKGQGRHRNASNSQGAGLEGRDSARHGRPGRRDSEHAQCWGQSWLAVAAEYGRMDDGISNWMERCFKTILGGSYAQSITKNQAKEMQVLRKEIQKKEVREKLGRLHSLEEAEVLLSFLLRIEEEPNRSNNVSQKSIKDEGVELSALWEPIEVRCSPQGWEYQKQLAGELRNLMPSLSYEGALEIAKAWSNLSFAYSSYVSSAASLDGFKFTKSKHREERLKALGNAIVPQVAERIMQGIKETEERKC